MTSSEIPIDLWHSSSYSHGHRAFTAELHADKSAHPGADLASKLAHAEIDGERLSSKEFQAFITLLVNAGGDTTRGLVGGGVVSLIRRPEILTRLHNLELAEEPAWVPSNFTCGPQRARITFSPSPRATTLA